MKYLVISDVHSNLEAMQAVLEYAGNLGYDQILCAGDIVGYNANPTEVIEILDNEKAICIRGNHDREVVRGTSPGEFNGPAAKAVVWTRANIQPASLAWLARLPQGPVTFDGFRLVHGSPRHEDEYVYGASDLRWPLLQADPRLDTPLEFDLRHPITKTPLITFFGHTHQPVAFDGLAFSQTSGIVRLEERSWMINPGSVGQPRDGDARTSFVIWNASEGTAKFYRIPYNFQLTQKKILAAGLPASLATRLG